MAERAKLCADTFLYFSFVLFARTGGERWRVGKVWWVFSAGCDIIFVYL